MKKSYIKALIFCFIYYVIIQFAEIIARFLETSKYTGLYDFNCKINFKSIYEIFNIITLILIVTALFIFLRKTKVKDLYADTKKIMRKHWKKYLLLILFVFSMASNSIVGTGILAEKILSTELFYTFSLNHLFASICISELFMSEHATIFFIFAPFICHIVVYARQKISNT